MISMLPFDTQFLPFFYNNEEKNLDKKRTK